MSSPGKDLPPVIAVDLGGSKIAIGIISSGYEILAREHHLTRADDGPKAVIDRIVSAIRQISADNSLPLSRISGISIAAAGAINDREGIITLSPNLPGWHDVPLGNIISERLGIKTWLINDANAAALGEHKLGAGKGIANLIYLVVGTGIGGAIIINGELYTGVCGSAGEIGHMTIENRTGPKCACGNTGCFELLASGTAMINEARKRIAGGEESSLSASGKSVPEDLNAKDIEMAAQSGDKLADSVIYNAATYLGIGMVNLVNIFNPGMIIISGGIANMGDRLLNPARQVVMERAFPIAANTVRIVPTALKNNAGLLGAAYLAFHSIGMEEKNEGS